MVKKLLVPALAVLFFISCNSSSDNTVHVPVQKDITTTFMVYLPGTDLEAKPKHQRYDGSGSRNLVSMMTVDNSSKLNIIVQTGASDVDYTNFTPEEPYVTPVKDWRTVQRHKITKGTITKLQTVGKSCLNDPKITNCVEMGTPEALAEFIRYSATNYPADRYILVLWDHGAGPIGGYGGAEVKTMYMNDMLKAFEAVKDIKFDIIGFDACLMASVEIAYNLKKYGKYMLASEELEPGLGWNYSVPLNAIVKNPNISNSDIGKIFIDEFIELNKKEGLLALSLVDLSKVDAVVTAIDAFAVEALKQFNNDKQFQWVKLFKARSKSDEFAKLETEKRYLNLVDIGDFADKLKLDGYKEYGTLLTSLKSALKNAVVHNRTDDTHTPSQGLSLYFPFNFFGTPKVETSINPYNNNYTNELTKAAFSTKYKELMHALVDYAEQTPSDIAVGTNSAVQSQYLTTDVTSKFNIDTSIVLVDTSKDAAEYKLYTARPADVVNSSQPNKFNIVAKIDNSAFAIDDKHVYLEMLGRHGLYEKNVYSFEVEAYVLEPNAKDRNILNAPLATLAVLVDVSTGKGIVRSTAFPENSTGRDGILLAKGVKIMLPETIYNKATKVKTLRKQESRVITLGENGAKDLTLEMTPLLSEDSNAKIAFYVTDLKGKGALSNFFNTNGTPVTRSFEIDSSADDRQALADALTQPYK